MAARMARRIAVIDITDGTVHAFAMMYWIDLFGVFVFALSGALAADRRGMDIFGYIVLALLPAVGGGTVRDIVLDAPVFWVQDPIYLWLILAAAGLTFLAANVIGRVERLLIWADAIGLSVFCVAGAAKTLALTGSPAIAVAMGVVTAVMGGIIRDVVCNEIPLVLRQDIYATAAFLGALVFVTLVGLNLVGSANAMWIAAASCFIVRGAAIIWRLSLPKRGAG